MKYWKPAAGLLGVAVVVFAAVTLTGQSKPVEPAGCGVYRNDRTITIKGQAFKAEVAKNTNEFEKGLGGRACINYDRAMIFAFTQPGQYPFWMKGMKFPIDIIWIGPDRKIAAIQPDLQPTTYPNRFQNQLSHPAQYVLEVKAGTAAGLGLMIGTPVGL